jgi:hypothetical protein
VLALFRQNTIATVAALLLFALLLTVHALGHLPAAAELGSFHRGLFFTWDWMPLAFAAAPKTYIVLSAGFHLLLGLYANFLVNREKFYSRKTYLTALCYLLLGAMLPVFRVFSVQSLAALFLLMALARTFTLTGTPYPRRSAYDIGFLVGLAVLCYFPSVVFLFLFPFVMMRFRTIMLQDLVAGILGILSPLYFAAALLYLSGKGELVLQPFLHLFLPVQTIRFPLFAALTLGSLVWLFYALYLVRKVAPRQPLLVRRKFSTLSLFFFFSVLAGLFAPVFPSAAWVLVLPSFSILLSLTLQQQSEKYNTFTLLLVLALLVAVQWLL